MAESADQQVVVELLAEVRQFAADIEGAANKLGVTFGNASDELKSHLDKSSGHLDTFAKHAEEKGKEAGENFTKGLILVAAAFATEFLAHIRDTIDRASEYASQLGTLSLITGDDPKKLQQFEFAMRSVGVASEQSQQQLSIFQRRVEEAGAKVDDTSSSFHRMGLNAKSMVGKDAITNFETVAKAIAGMASSTDRTAAAMDTFGSRLGSRLLPLLNQGKTGIQELMGAADSFGAIIDKKTLKALDDYEVAANRAKQATQAFFAVFSGPILPLLTHMTDAMSHFMAAFEKLPEVDRLLILFGALASTFAVFSEGLATVGSFMKGLVNKELIGFLVDWAGWLRVIVVVITGLAAAWMTNFAGIQSSLKPIGDGVQSLWKMLQEVGRELQEALLPAWITFESACRRLFAELGQVLSALLHNKAALDLLKTVLEVLAGLVVALVYAFVGLVDMFASIDLLIANLADSFADLESSIAKTERALASLSDTWQRVNPFRDPKTSPTAMGDSIRHDAEGWEKQGQHDREVARKMRIAHDAETRDAAERAKKHDTGKKPPGGGRYAPPDAPDTSLKSLRDTLIPFEDAIKETEARLHDLGDAYKDIGTIDTAAKLAMAQSNLNQQMQQTAILERQQHQLAMAARVAEGRAHGLEHGKNKEAATAAERSYHDQSIKALEAERDAETKILELRRQRLTIEQTYLSMIANDQSLSFKERELAIEKELKDMRASGLVSARALAIVHQQQLAILEKEHALTQAQRTFERTQDPANRNSTTAAQERITRRDDIPIDPSKITEINARRLADLNDEQIIATNKEIEARAALDTSIEHQRGIVDKNSQTYLEAQQTVNANSVAWQQAHQAMLQAAQAIKNFNDETTKDTQDVRSGFASIAQRAAPELVQSFKMMQDGVDPVTAIFLTLFEKTRSFWDILTIFQRIVAAIVPIFDALRPVLDFFLGVIVGIVDVFLTLYNVMASILNVLGAHLEKLRLVNTTLDDLGNTGAKPLLQIVHDLPTINEFNQGKWQDLNEKQNIANNYAQNANDILDTGFSQSLAKFGQIIGELIAIHTILAVMQGAQLLGGGGGGGGIFGFLKGLLGGGTAPSSFQNGIPVFGSPDNPATTLIVDSSGTVLGTDTTPLPVQWGSISDIPGPNIPGVGDAAQTLATSADVPATGGATASGDTAANAQNAMSLGKIAGGVGDLAAIYQGYKSGGVGGGISAGLGAFGLGHLLLTGGAAAGPAGLIAAGVVGLGAMLFGGPHTNPQKNPDLYGSQTGELDYGQGMANLGGAGANGLPLYTANGQSFAESQAALQKTGGMGEASFLTQWIKLNPQAAQKLLSPQEQQEFSNVTTMSYDKGGMVNLGNGPEHYWSQLVGDANDAINKIFSTIQQGATNTGQTLQDLFAAATNINVAQTFGNGNTISNPGAVTTRSDLGSMIGQQPPQITVSIGTVQGADPVALKQTFTTIMGDVQEKWAREGIMSRRVNQFIPGAGEAAYS